MPPIAPDSDHSLPFFTVGQVSTMLDVQQAFLRRLEEFELVAPERSDGNQRRYSRNDIDRVNEVVGLIDEGLTLAGVRRVLALQAEVDSLKAEIKALRRRS
jgi:MerR family transcriptional regulator/heat shock protein HspR